MNKINPFELYIVDYKLLPTNCKQFISEIMVNIHYDMVDMKPYPKYFVDVINEFANKYYLCLSDYKILKSFLINNWIFASKLIYD